MTDKYNGKELFTKDTKGKTRFWKATSNLELNADGHISILIEHGVLGSDKVVKKERFTKNGKNIGKINQTTIEEQALLDVSYLYQKQLDDGYVFNLDSYTEPLRPQLAHPYEKRKHTVKFDYKHPTAPNDYSNRYYASKKLDGVRLFVFVSNGKVIKFESRTGKPFKYFSHIATAIENNLSDVDKVLNNVVFDGELFNKNIPFNVLSSLINSDDYTTTEFNSVTYTTEQVQFHCYDRVNLDKKEEDYFTRFVNVSIPAENNIVFKIDNKIIKNEQDLITLGGKWISEGYEGLMLRNGWTPYDFGKRSNNLLKYKIMLDEEFLILDIIDSENEPGQPIFVVEVQKATDKEEALTCNVRMKGEKKENEKYLINKKDYINKWLKVQYQAKSEYNIPLFPVGLEVREGTVIDGKFIPTF